MTKLFLSFVKKEYLFYEIDKIKKLHYSEKDDFEVKNKKIIVLKNKNYDDNDYYYLLYNVISSDFSKIKQLLRNTIIVHRKREINCIYTINGLNCLIKSLNGEIDHSYKVNWQNYKNVIILVKENQNHVPENYFIETVYYKTIRI